MVTRRDVQPQAGTLAKANTNSAGAVAPTPTIRPQGGNGSSLALEGRLEAVYGYSFVLTNLDLKTPNTIRRAHAENLAETEWWYRHRTDIEALNKDAEHGAALRHLPSADRRVNSVWMWAALLACAISSWTQELAGIDRGNGRGDSRGQAMAGVSSPA